MSLESWGFLLLGVGVVLLVWGYLIGEQKLDELECDLEYRRALQRLYEADRAVPDWSRTALYDWSERGEL